MNTYMYYVLGIGHTDRPWGRCLSLCLLEVDMKRGEGRQYKPVICPIFCTPPTAPNMVISSNIHTDSLFCPLISPTPEVSGFPCLWLVFMSLKPHLQFQGVLSYTTIKQGLHDKYCIGCYAHRSEIWGK